MFLARASAAVWLCALSAVPAAAQLAVLSDVDTAGDVGRQSAVTFGSDGLPLIAYYDATNGDLKVAHCLGADCARSTRTVIDKASEAQLSIAVGTDGRGIVAYGDPVAGTARVAHCSDASCTSASIATLGPARTDRGTAVAVGLDGLPLVAFAGPNGLLVVAHCSDAACGSATFAETQFSVTRPSIAVAPDGRPVLAFTNGFDSYVVACLDVQCTATTPSFVRFAGQVPPQPGQMGTSVSYYDIVIAARPGELPTFIYSSEVRDYIPAALTPRLQTFVGRCRTAACTSFDGFGQITGGSYEPALTLSPTGGLRVAQRQLHSQVGSPVQNRLGVGRCDLPGPCGSSTQVLGAPGSGFNPSIAMGPDGIALVSFYDATGMDLKAAYLGGWDLAELSLSMTAAPNPVAPGQTLRYDITANNRGGTTATAVSLRAGLPPGAVFDAAPIGNCSYSAADHAVDCAPGPLAAGASALAVRVQVRVPLIEPVPLTLTASIDSPEPDAEPSNNTGTMAVPMRRWIGLGPASVTEGNRGTTQLRFPLVLHDTVPPGPQARVTVSTAPGSASPTSDYVPVSGVVTFPPGFPEHDVVVPVLGDTVVEGNEWFQLLLTSPHDAVVPVPQADGVIVDDDASVQAVVGELGHGGAQWGDLAGAPPPSGRRYRTAQAPYSSYEVVLDGASGDVRSLQLSRLAGDGSTLLQSGTADGTGSSLRLAWTNTSAAANLTELVRVQNGGCASGCTTDDVYRIRAYDTTARVSRFNNVGGQVTVIVLQNRTDRHVAGRAFLWSASGAPLGSVSLSLGSHATTVLDTSATAPAASGSLSIVHDGGYGAIVGKAVSLEPATGLAFDTPLEVRPR